MKSKTRHLGPLTAPLFAMLLVACAEPTHRGATSATAASVAASQATTSSAVDVPAPTPIPSNPSDDPPGSVATPNTAPLGDLLANATRLEVRGGRAEPAIGTDDALKLQAFLRALGPAQTVDGFFGSKCLTETQLSFYAKDGRALGTVGFCEGDSKLEAARFDGSGITKGLVRVSDATQLATLLRDLRAAK